MPITTLIYASAIVCIITRGFLSVIDRSILKEQENVLVQIIFLNSLLPFFVGLLITHILYRENNVFNDLFDIKIILNALGAQATAIAFSIGFKNMTVRNVTAISKVTDLFIPILIFLITREFSAKEYFFSCASVLIFLPIFYSVNKDNDFFNFKHAVIIWLAILFQAAINIVFNSYDVVNTGDKFMNFICCILFWRVIFSLPFFYLSLSKKQKISYKNNFFKLTCRAFLAFVSQAAFFFSITKTSSLIAWPILNSGPLVTCAIAHLFIRENLKKSEYLTILLFMLLSGLYLLY